MKVIKRYANRKLYDTENSTYVTLDEIARMVKDGVEFQIVDNKSKRDITSQTLAQILCEEEKRQPQDTSLLALRSLIRTGEDFLQRRLRAPLTEMGDRTRETVERIIGRGGEAEPAENEPPPEPPAPPAEQEEGDVRTAFGDLLESFQRRLDESLHAADARARRVLDGMTHLPELLGELHALHERISKLEQRVAALDGGSAESPNPSGPPVNSGEPPAVP